MYNTKLIIYVFDKKILNNSLEDLVIKILNDLKEYYNLKLKSSYDIKVYTNKYYGIILEIDENGYYEDNIVKINIKLLKNTLFLYQIDDPLDYLDNEIYYYDNQFFINSKKEDIRLIENSNIVYGEDVYKIIGKGIKI